MYFRPGEPLTHRFAFLGRLSHRSKIGECPIGKCFSAVAHIKKRGHGGAFSLRLIDFSTSFSVKKQKVSGIMGTLAYLSPEIILGSSISQDF